MLKDLRSSALAVVVLTIALGLAYPLVVTGISQVAFGGSADGKLVRDAGGRVVGSTLIARATGGDPRLFTPRPSATGYDPSATFFRNLGPNSATAAELYRGRIAAYLKANGSQNPGLTAAGVPADAVTTSASGVDPLISERNADIQARRVAAARGLPLARVMALVADHRVGRFAGVFGEPGINTTTLNFALEGIQS
jgi:potassium-transporting ATPase KdpC subunit